MKLNNKAIKMIGMGATVIGFGLTLIQNYVDETKKSEMVREEVTKQLNELQKESK